MSLTSHKQVKINDLQLFAIPHENKPDNMSTEALNNLSVMRKSLQHTPVNFIIYACRNKSPLAFIANKNNNFQTKHYLN